MNIRPKLLIVILAISIIPLSFITVLILNNAATLVYREIPNNALAVVQISKLENLAMAIGLIIAALVAVVSLITAKSIADPITRLTKTVSDISRGKLDTEIGADLKESRDEIGELARAFDRTIVSLKLAMKKVGSAPKQEEEKK